MTNFSLVDDSSRKIHVHIARQIARKILSGELKPNDKLPCETTLCDALGVSRTSLREATKLLSGKGLIESKTKVGTKVLPRNYWHFLDSQIIDWMEYLDDNQVFLHQFLGLRKAIEPEACALAASNATDEHKLILTTTFQNMVMAANRFDLEDWTMNDHLFHKTIFLATGNQFYLPFGNILTSIFKQFIDHSVEGGRFCLNEHQAIYDAIIAGDVQRARSASQMLLNDENQRLSLTING